MFLIMDWNIGFFVFYKSFLVIFEVVVIMIVLS